MKFFVSWYEVPEIRQEREFDDLGPALRFWHSRLPEDDPRLFYRVTA